MRTPRTALLIGAAAVAVSSLGPLAPPAQALRVTPESPATPGAEDETLAYVVMLVIGIALIVAINAALILAVRRFRAERGEIPERVHSGRGLIPRIAGALAALALVAFTFGVITNESSTGAPTSTEGTEPLEVLVSGQQWLWRFEYPDEEETFAYHELVVPVDTPVKLRVVSTDVVHRWWVPALGRAVDAAPGTENVAWFQAEETGVYQGRSTEFSGPAFAQMRARVRVVEQDEYERWLAEQAADIEAAQGRVRDAVSSESGDQSAGEGGGSGQTGGSAAGAGPGQGPSSAGGGGS